ncbi:MAG: coenzyme F420-0:L-glutamate ligase [Methanobacterium sp.]|nr:coenzyme F420-0:L-glutamate ligase [Methanobacterium sp.]
MCVKLIGIENIPMVSPGDDIGTIIIEAAKSEGLEIMDHDIFVVAETVVSKAEGNLIELDSINVSAQAQEISEKTSKDPRIVQSIIDESVEIIKVGPNFIISETKHGFVCANAGIDESNVESGFLKPIPVDSDESASLIRKTIESATGKNVAVILSDTQGRPFREGAVGVAIGVSGINPLWNRQGERDLYDRKLETTTIAVADELASAASIVMGQANEGLPVVIVRGVEYAEKLRSTYSDIKPILRPKKFDVFR